MKTKIKIASHSKNWPCQCGIFSPFATMTAWQQHLMFLTNLMMFHCWTSSSKVNLEDLVDFSGTLSPPTLTTIISVQGDPTLIGEQDSRPLLHCPDHMVLFPLQIDATLKCLVLDPISKSDCTEYDSYVKNTKLGVFITHNTIASIL